MSARLIARQGTDWGTTRVDASDWQSYVKRVEKTVPIDAKMKTENETPRILDIYICITEGLQAGCLVLIWQYATIHALGD